MNTKKTANYSVKCRFFYVVKTGFTNQRKKLSPPLGTLQVY